MASPKALIKTYLPKLVGLFLFDAVWFAAVAGRGEWLALTLVLVAAQVVLALRTGPLSWRLYVALLVLGLALEASVVSMGILRFSEGWLPIWLVLLWVGFVGMLMNTLSGLAGRPWWAALLGIAAGPLTYAIGARLGAAEILVEEWLLWLVYGLLWAAYMVIFALVSQRIKQTQEGSHDVISNSSQSS